MGFTVPRDSVPSENTFQVDIASNDGYREEYSFQWIHFLYPKLEQDRNDRDERVIFEVSTHHVLIVGMRLQGLYDALKSQRLLTVRRDVTGGPDAVGIGPDDPLVSTITVTRT